MSKRTDPDAAFACAPAVLNRGGTSLEVRVATSLTIALIKQELRRSDQSHAARVGHPKQVEDDLFPRRGACWSNAVTLSLHDLFLSK